jgi:Ca-activated chloride channel family protein
MNFLAPELLPGLILIPLVVLAYLVLQRRRTKYAVRFTNLDLLANLAPRRPAWRRHVPPAIYVAAVAALLLALARPTMVLATPRDDAAVIMAVDVSGSMSATDVSPTRLDAAKQAARLFLAQLPSRIRVGLVSFSNQPVTLVSPTDDREAVLAAIDSLEPFEGTALGDAVVRVVDLAEAVRNAAVDAAPSVSGSPAPAATPDPTAAPSADPSAPAGVASGNSLVAGILLSDGANSTGEADPITAAQRAADYSVPIYTISLGTDAGQIQAVDRSGRPVLMDVPPDRATMARIAEITGAASFEAPTAGDLEAVYSDLQSRIGYINREQEVTAYLAGGGLILVLAGAGLAAVWFGRLP